MPQKRYLLTPGPTPVPPEVLAALARAGHPPPLAGLQERVRARRVRACARSSAPTNEVLVFTASGTGAFESAVANLLSPGEKVLAVSHGNFGTRWQKLAAAFGCDVVDADLRLGPDARRRRRRDATLAESGARVAFLVHSETSTGVVADIQLARRRLQRRGRDLRRRRDLEPRRRAARDRRLGHRRRRHGLAEGADDAARARVRIASPSAPGRRPRARPCRGSTGTGRGHGRAQEKDNTPFTPATSTVVALNAALELILAEGLESVFARHVALGRACRAGAKAMGLELYSPDDDSAAVLTGILTPEGIDAVALAARAPRPLRHHDRRRPRRHRRPALPDRPHRLRRHLRHHDRAGGDRAAARRDGRDASSAALPARPPSRRTSRPPERCGFSSASRSPRPGSSCCARGSRSTTMRTTPLEEIIGRYDAIVIRSATKLTAELIERADEPEDDRSRRRRRRQRRRRRGDAARNRRRERARVDRRLGRRADGRADGRARAQHPAGARGAEAGPLGAVEVERHRARGQDARRARLRPDRPAGRAPGGRASACTSIAYDPFVGDDRFRELGVEHAAVGRRRARGGRLPHACTRRSPTRRGG